MTDRGRPQDRDESPSPPFKDPSLAERVRRVLRDIARGAEKGKLFENREELLPIRKGGYYREYDVPTPGLGTRGKLRLVLGRGGERYYFTRDHFKPRTFVQF